MRVVVYNHLGTGPEHEETFEGPPEHVETYLRRAFPFLNREVIHGDLSGCLEAIDEQQLYSVEIQQGEHEVVHHQPFLIKHLREQGEDLEKADVGDPSAFPAPPEGSRTPWTTTEKHIENTKHWAKGQPYRVAWIPIGKLDRFTRGAIRSGEAGHGDQHVRRYIDEMRSGKQHPPAVVYPSGGGWVLWDGNHRAAAAHALKATHVPAIVVNEPQQDISMRKGEDLGKMARLDPSLDYTISHKTDRGHDADTHERWTVTHVRALDSGGDLIGHASFDHRPDHLEASLVSVKPAHRRHGLASAMYAYAEKKTGLKVKPSENQTEDGAALWAGNAQDPQFGKSEDNYTIPLDAEANLAWEMQGFQAQADALFDTARWMAGEASASPHHLRQSLLKHDGDIELAALAAYGLDLTEENLHALRGLAGSGVIIKAEPEAIAPPQSLIPAHPDASETAVEVERAFNAGSFHIVNLNGKHSTGSMIGRDPESRHLYLLKPGSGDNSPAMGVHEESASQSRREAAFWHVADLLGLGEYFPRADLLYIEGREIAAIRMLPTDYKNLGTALKQNPSMMPHIMRPYLVSGLLHKWGALDFILGNPDRHSQNIMVDPDRRSLRLIDHGSALAGRSFDPAHDENSFIPYYLRCWTGAKFHSLEPAQQFRQMPTAGIDGEKALARWISDIDPDRLAAKLQSYGVDSQPEVERLEYLKLLPGPKDLAVNKLWLGIGTEHPHT